MFSWAALKQLLVGMWFDADILL